MSKAEICHGLLFDHRVLPRLKGHFYKAGVTLAILYRAECWTRKKQEVKVYGVRKQTLRGICRVTGKDKITNKHKR